MKINLLTRFAVVLALFMVLSAERCVEITELKAPATVDAGTVFTATTRLKRLHESGPSNFQVEYFLSYDRYWNNEDIALGFYPVGDCQPGEWREVDADLIMPAATFDGEYFLLAKANDGEMYRPITVDGPANNGADFVPIHLFIYGGLNPADTFRYAFALHNRGQQPANNCTIRAYFSTDLIPSADDVVAQDLALNYPLAPGARREYMASFLVPDNLTYDVPKDWYFLVVADADHVVAETTENNNVVSRLLSIGPSEGLTNSEGPEAAPQAPMADIALGPNPTTDFLDFSCRLSDAAPVSLTVFDVTGSPVYAMPEQRIEAGDYTQRLNLSDRPAGLYIVQICVDGRQTVKKIIKQ